MERLELRVPPPLLAVGLAVLMWVVDRLLPGSAAPVAARWLAALCLVASGGLAGSAVAAFVRARTTISPVQIDRASSLVTTGIYRLTRNPMYLGLALLLIALALVLWSPVAVLGPVVFVAWIDRFQIRPEERLLTARFGAAYAAYCARVRRWV